MNVVGRHDGRADSCDDHRPGPSPLEYAWMVRQSSFRERAHFWEIARSKFRQSSARQLVGSTYRGLGERALQVEYYGPGWDHVGVRTI